MFDVPLEDIYSNPCDYINVDIQEYIQSFLIISFSQRKPNHSFCYVKCNGKPPRLTQNNLHLCLYPKQPNIKRTHVSVKNMTTSKLSL